MRWGLAAPFGFGFAKGASSAVAALTGYAAKYLDGAVGYQFYGAGGDGATKAWVGGSTTSGASSKALAVKAGTTGLVTQKSVTLASSTADQSLKPAYVSADGGAIWPGYGVYSSAYRPTAFRLDGDGAAVWGGSFSSAADFLQAAATDGTRAVMVGGSAGGAMLLLGLAASDGAVSWAKTVTAAIYSGGSASGYLYDVCLMDNAKFGFAGFDGSTDRRGIIGGITEAGTVSWQSEIKLASNDIQFLGCAAGGGKIAAVGRMTQGGSATYDAGIVSVLDDDGGSGGHSFTAKYTLSGQVVNFNAARIDAANSIIYVAGRITSSGAATGKMLIAALALADGAVSWAYSIGVGNATEQAQGCEIMTGAALIAGLVSADRPALALVKSDGTIDGCSGLTSVSLTKGSAGTTHSGGNSPSATTVTGSFTKTSRALTIATTTYSGTSLC